LNYSNPKYPFDDFLPNGIGEIPVDQLETTRFRGRSN